MAQHDVGLHTNYHSVHPTVAEYLEGKDWDEGIEEVVERERSGVTDMTRILGREPSCWGRAGSTWGPQVAPALQRLGVPAMMYSYTHLADARHHIHRFCGTLSYSWSSAAARPSPRCCLHAVGRRFDHIARNQEEGCLLPSCRHPVTIRAESSGTS